VGENSYSIELGTTPEGSLACDIAGVRTSLKAPLEISVRSGAGEELLATQSDEFGNSHFVVPAASPSDDLRVFMLSLKGIERQFLFRVP
jgi:hypothetical protein